MLQKGFSYYVFLGKCFQSFNTLNTMEFNGLFNPFKFGFFTKKVNDLFYILYMNPIFGTTARFSMQKSIPDYINPNFDLPEVGDFKYNKETGVFTSGIGNGKFIFTEDNQFKVVFENFKYNDIPNLELDFSIKLNHNMEKNPNEGLKI